jgi:hypothetical protein
MLKIREYFVIAYWALFAKGKANLFWYHHQKGMSDYFAFNEAKKHSNKYCKLLSRSLTRAEKGRNDRRE